MTSLSQTNIAECQKISMVHDADRYVLSLFCKRTCRPSIWALIAFNHEISKTREIVTDTTLGLIRLQWWRDVLDDIYAGKEARKHAVVEGVAHAIQKYDLPKEHFETLLYAREFDLEDKAPDSLEGLKNYCDFTNTALLKLIAQCESATFEDKDIQKIGTAYGLVGTVRSLPYLSKERFCLIPESVVLANNISAEILFDLSPELPFRQLLDPIVSEAQNMLRQNERHVQSNFVKKAKKLTLLYCTRLEAAEFSPYHPQFYTDIPFKALRLMV